MCQERESEVSLFQHGLSWCECLISQAKFYCQIQSHTIVGIVPSYLSWINPKIIMIEGRDMGYKEEAMKYCSRSDVKGILVLAGPLFYKGF